MQFGIAVAPYSSAKSPLSAAPRATRDWQRQAGQELRVTEGETGGLMVFCLFQTI